MEVELLSKWSTVLDIVFHRAVFAAVLLLYIIVLLVDYIIDIMSIPWGIYLLVPVIIFGLIGYIVDEMR